MGEVRGGPERLRLAQDGPDTNRLLAEFMSDRRSFSLRTPPNKDTFESTQKWLNGNPDAIGGLMHLKSTYGAERAGIKDSLTRSFFRLTDLERSATDEQPAPSREEMLRRPMMSTIQCHQPQQRFEPPAEPYRVNDLIPPPANQNVVDALSRRAVGIAKRNLAENDQAAFETAIKAFEKRNGVSVEDRANILASMCVLMSPGHNRPLNDAACRRLALGLAQVLAEPPADGAGDLRLAQKNPSQLAEYVRNMAVRGSAQHSEGGHRQLEDAAKKEINEAATPLKALDRLLGSTRAVIPDSLYVDLRKLDDPGSANFAMTDDVKKILRQIHDADHHLQTISITHKDNGDDLIRIGLDAARTEGEGVSKITFAKSLEMTVHRNGDGSVHLKNLKGISTPLADPTELQLGVPGAADRRIIAITWAQDRNVTNEIGAGQIEQFDQMIRVLNDINRQRR